MSAGIVRRWFGIAAMASLLAVAAQAGVTHYVWSSGANNSPYTNWADAAQTITAAVAVAVAGDTVLVTNGTYTLAATIIVTNAITVQGVNRDATIVDGNNTVRCFSNSAAVLDSLTIIRGKHNVYGAGVQMFYASSAATVTNCTIRDCESASEGGAVTIGNGAIRNSTISGNKTTLANSMGGGIEAYYDAVVADCLIASNSTPLSGYGGGLYLQQGAKVINCTIVGNTAGRGGGLYTYAECYVTNCTIISNTANATVSSIYGGGGVCMAQGTVASRFVGCLIAGNDSTTNGGGVSFYSGPGKLESCTIVRNRSSGKGGGIGVAAGGSPAPTGVETNCIIYNNQAVLGSNDFDTTSSTFGYCCSPDVTHGMNGNITNIPAFMDAGSGYGTNSVAGSYRLNADSPCINAGMNQCWMTNAVDLDGRMRIRYGTVDMGAYELILSGTMYGFH